VLPLVSSDWTNERDPSLSIEWIDVPVRRPRAEPATHARKLVMTAQLGSFMAIWFVDRIEQFRKERVRQQAKARRYLADRRPG